jgi:anti-sigma regulatory factor (Ser/Thr protein kinase)
VTVSGGSMVGRTPGVDDDALMSADSGRLRHLQLAPSPRAPAEARDFVAGVSASTAMDDSALETAQLLTTELVTNSYLHAGLGPNDEILVWMSLSGPLLRVEVCDCGPGIDAAVAAPELLDTEGRGLWMVNVLAARWGTARRHGLSCVWFEVSSPTSDRKRGFG